MNFPDQYRLHLNGTQYETSDGSPFGVFMIPGRAANGRILKVLANDKEGTGWEHVSVTIEGQPNKCPSWDEMCIVKNLFWPEDQTVVQYHPAKKNYVNVHSGCLHLWRCPEQVFPTPPNFCV